MRMTRLMLSTLREDPADAEIPSHRLLFRAGMIRKAAGGVYVYMPLALKVLRKISQIVREEMDEQGGQEVQLPILQPAEAWRETGRWDKYGAEMFKLRDRHDRDFCLGPTHEELITTLVRGEIRSYRQLPLLVYQIANKYRDELRPRFGLMRGREFVMKDLYSFDVDEAGLDLSYDKMHHAYCQVFRRCGLSFRAVEADAGLIGGNSSHEFMVLAASGEAGVVFCSKCDYAANLERAECAAATPANGGGTAHAASAAGVTGPGTAGAAGPVEVHTPGAKSIQQVAAMLSCAPEVLIKTLLFTDGERLFAALVRGDLDVNETKLARILETAELALADEGLVEDATGAPMGFAGPVGLPTNIRIVADSSIFTIAKAVVGANKADAHLTNVDPRSDFRVDIVSDIRLVREGDACPRCGESLETARGIEVGHIFKLGTKYSAPLKANYLDQSGQEQAMVMGCYGIGVSRTLAAIVEQHHDDQGIVWPMSVAPYHVVVVPVSTKDEAQVAAAESIYAQLQRAGIEVVLDDRDERPGVKFKDADLVGFPIRVTVGPKALADGEAEVKLRAEANSGRVALSEVCAHVVGLVAVAQVGGSRAV